MKSFRAALILLPGLPSLLLCCSDSDSDKTPASSVRVDAGSDDAPERFVGDVDDSDVRVAVVTDRQRARLFFCGGMQSVASATHWFNVDLDGDEVDAEEQGFKLHARFADDTVEGEITGPSDGDARSFTLAPVAKGTIGGLYEGKGECGRIALIASQSNEDAEVEGQGACVGPGRTPEQVNPITPIALQQGGVPVESPGAGDTVILQPAGLTPLPL
ncbi:MAG: hypothetical protein ABW321_17555 [Polyangiales bacterium]